MSLKNTDVYYIHQVGKNEHLDEIFVVAGNAQAKKTKTVGVIGS